MEAVVMEGGGWREVEPCLSLFLQDLGALGLGGT